MSMSKQTRAFAKQVQVDLLALCDTDLFQTLHLWVNEEPSGPLCEGSKQTRSVLGYTLRMGEPHPLSSSILSGSELEAAIQWLAPAPQRLRELLMDMKLDLFIEYVFPLAFPSRHMIHPEWGEGATFNAHLANHLRWIGMKQKGMTAGPETPPRYLPKELSRDRGASKKWHLGSEMAHSISRIDELDEWLDAHTSSTIVLLMRWSTSIRRCTRRSEHLC